MSSVATDSPHTSAHLRVRPALAALLALIALSLVIFALLPLGTPHPATVLDAAAGATIELSADRTAIPFRHDCIHVTWTVTGAREVRVMADTVEGNGQRAICGATPRVQVFLDDGSAREYRFDRDILLDRTSTRALLFGGVVLAVAAGLVVGWLPAQWRRTPIARPVRRAVSSIRALTSAIHADTRAHVADDSPLWTYAVALLTLIGAILRIHYTLDLPIRGDEAGTYLGFLVEPLPVAISYYPYPNNHLFFTLLAWFSHAIFGNEVWVLRIPALVSGILVVPATYVLGRRLYCSAVGLLAAALAASATYLIEYTANARGYSVQLLIVLLMLWLASYLKRHDNRTGWILLAVLAALGFYAIPTMLFPFGIVALWLLLSILAENTGGQRLKLLRHYVLSMVGAGLLTLLLYLPVFIVSGVGAVTNNEFVRPLSWEVFARELPELLRGLWVRWTLDIPAPLVWALVLGVILSIVFHPKITRDKIMLSVVAIVWVEAVMIARRNLPFERVLLFAIPLFYIFASAGLVYVAQALRVHRWRYWRPAVMLAGVAVSALIAVNVLQHAVLYRLGAETGGFPNAEDVALALKPELRPGDEVNLVYNSFSMLLYHFHKNQIPADYLSMDGSDPVARTFAVVNTQSQNLERVLRETRINPAAYQPPELIARFSRAEIYLFRRR